MPLKMGASKLVPPAAVRSPLAESSKPAVQLLCWFDCQGPFEPLSLLQNR